MHVIIYTRGSTINTINNIHTCIYTLVPRPIYIFLKILDPTQCLYIVHMQKNYKFTMHTPRLI